MLWMDGSHSHEKLEDFSYIAHKQTGLHQDPTLRLTSAKSAPLDPPSVPEKSVKRAGPVTQLTSEASNTSRKPDAQSMHRVDFDGHVQSPAFPS